DGDPVARPQVPGSDGGKTQAARGSEKPARKRISKDTSTLAREPTVGGFTLLPGAHAIGHPFMEVGRADDSLGGPEPHWLSYLVANPGEGEGDTLALQLLDRGQQLVAGTDVDEVH